MAKVVLTGLSKAFSGGTIGLDNIDLTVADGEFVVLVGRPDAASPRCCE